MPRLLRTSIANLALWADFLTVASANSGPSFSTTASIDSRSGSPSARWWLTGTYAALPGAHENESPASDVWNALALVVITPNVNAFADLSFFMRAVRSFAA